MPSSQDIKTDDDMKLSSMMVQGNVDPRYAAGGGQSIPQTDDDALANPFKKKSSKSKTKSKKLEGAPEVFEDNDADGSQPRSDSPVSQFTTDPPDYGRGSGGNYNATSPVHSVATRSHAASIRSVDPDGGHDLEGDALGEVWEITRPPGLVQDGGNDNGYFFVPSPASADGNHFRAFLTNQKYTLRYSPCIDWRSWMQNHPHRTLIHFSDVPREALEKGRHVLENKPGSAFFSQTQLSLREDYGVGDGYEDSGSYAQMFYLPPSRGMDPNDRYMASAMSRGMPEPSSRQFRKFEKWLSETGQPPPGQSRGPPVERADGGVSFLRKGFTQNIVAGIVAFTGPGLFNAMQGLGNAGGSDPTVAATMNAVLYATFSFFGVLSGSMFNILGTKILMSFGAATYGFYAISVYLWGQVDDSYAGMAIAASAILGLGAACLWGAQGTMTLSYARESEKGLFFGLFWLIFNMGGVMGGFISMGINSGPVEERATSVTPETYFTFCGLMAAGSVFAFIFVIRPSRVVKSDGTAVDFEQTDAAEGVGELKEVGKLFTNKYMLLLTPLIIQSNWFYAYEFGGINGLLFDAPTRGLNSAIYWGISGVSSYVAGNYYLDKESYGGRNHRAIYGLAMISAINIGQWVYAIAYQFSTGYDKGNQPEPLINYTDGGRYAAPMILFMYCGLADSLVQTYAYWIIGAITNSPKTLSRYVGYYKGIQSFGACLAWIIEAEGTSYRAQLLICSALAVLFIPPTYKVALSIEDEGGVIEEKYAEYEAAQMKERQNAQGGSGRGREKKPARIV